MSSPSTPANGVEGELSSAREAKPASRILAMGQNIWQWVQRTRPYRTVSRFTDVGGNVLSAGMSFQALFAVFAALWVGFGILAIWARGQTELIDELSHQINIYVPGLIETDTQNGAVSITELLSRGAISWTSIVAAVALIWVALTWFTGTRRAIRLIFGLDVKLYRNAVLLKIRDFLGALTFFVAILLSAALTIVSSTLFSWLLATLGVDEDHWFIGTLGLTVRYAAMFALDTMIIMGIHRWLAEVDVPFWVLLQGSALGAVALGGLKVLATSLLTGAGSNPLLASFAVIVGLLVWFNFICRVLLLTASWIATGQDNTLGLPDKSSTLLDL